MKKLMLASFMGAVFMTSCGEKKTEKKETPDPKSQIIGEWVLNHAHYQEFENGVKTDEYDEYLDIKFVFSKNDFQMIDRNDTLESGSYTLTSDSLIMGLDEEGRFKLIELNNDELHVEQTFIYTEDSITYKDIVNAYFDKK